MFMKKIVDYFLIGCYLSVGFIENFGSVDRVSAQYVFLGLINALSLFYFISKTSTPSISDLKQNQPLLIIVLFFIWSALSIFYSISVLDTLESLSNIFLVMMSMINMYIHISEIKDLKKVFIFILFPLILFELIIPFKIFLEIISTEKAFDFSMSGRLKTFTPNKNITAAIIACHLPFLLLIFNYWKLRGKVFYILFTLFFSIGFINIFFLSSRASIIGIVFSLLFTYGIIFIKKTPPPKILNFFTIILILVFLSSSIYLGSDSTASLGNRFSSIDQSDQSTQERLRFYEHGFEHIKKNPIIGLGLGNWKLKSIEYDKNNITGYTVPYHLHNDFLQYGTELGLVGLFLYAFLFLKILLINLKRIEVNFNLSVILIFSLTILFVDSNLNFPYHRPIMMILFGFIIALTHYNKKHEIEK